MIHTSFFWYVTVALVATWITMIVLLSGRERPWYYYPRPHPVVGTSVKTGLAVATLLTLFVATYGHSALARNAASAHESAAYILACGFGATFTVVTVAVLILLASRRL